jgi:hypothetical protein
MYDARFSRVALTSRIRRDRPAMRRTSILSLLALSAGLAGCESPTPAQCVDAGGYPGPINNVYLVFYEEGVPVQPTTDRLARRHGFTPQFVYDALGGFAAPLSKPAYEGLRCESEVRSMGPNELAGGGG